MKTALWVSAGALVLAGAFTVWASPDSRGPLGWYWAWSTKALNAHYWKQKSQWK